MPRQPRRRPAGRPKVPADERFSRVNTTVSPSVRDYLAAAGDGSTGRGARLVLIRAAELAAAGKNILS